VRQPANGKVWIQDGKDKIQENLFGATRSCVGRTVAAKEIMYVSDPGFQGTDKVLYETVMDKGNTVAVTVAIEVK
jgi:hypothetical protein